MQSYSRVREAFEERFPGVKPSMKSIMFQLVAKFREICSCANLNELQQRIKDEIACGPHYTIRQTGE